MQIARNLPKHYLVTELVSDGISRTIANIPLMHFSERDFHSSKFLLRKGEDLNSRRIFCFSNKKEYCGSNCLFMIAYPFHLRPPRLGFMKA